MAHSVDISMISPPTSSSISTDQDPFGQLPPLLPPLRSTQVLKPLTAFPGGILHKKRKLYHDISKNHYFRSNACLCVLIPQKFFV